MGNLLFLNRVTWMYQQKISMGSRLNFVRTDDGVTVRSNLDRGVDFRVQRCAKSHLLLTIIGSLVTQCSPYHIIEWIIESHYTVCFIRSRINRL